jgi:hypothetical protein
LDSNRSVYALTNQYPDLIEALASLGFSGLAEPNMLNTVGRVVSLKTGAKIKGIEWESIRAALANKGFNVV